MDLAQLLPTTFTKTLNFSHKNIASIGQLAAQNPFLKVTNLHLSHNQISSHLFKFIIAHLQGITQFTLLKSLSLSNNKISDINELQHIPNQIQYLTLTSNPLNAYDYHDVCYTIFPKLKRLDGQVVDSRLVQQQRDISAKVSRWLIPFVYQLELYVEQLQKTIDIRSLSGEVNRNSGLQPLNDDCIVQIKWKQIEKLLEFRKTPTLQHLAQIIQLDLKEQLNSDQSRRFKQIHYETFKLLIKVLANQKYTSFIDFLISQSESDDYYATFLKIQKPQAHIAQDLYVVNDENKQEQSVKLNLEVPTYLKSKLNNQIVIQNSYSKPKKQQYFEKQQFYQYFPVFPFRTEYVQSVVNIVNMKLGEIQNLFQQIIQLYTIQQSPLPSIRTQRRKPIRANNSKEPTPNRMVPLPIVQEETIQTRQSTCVDVQENLQEKIVKEYNLRRLINLLQSIVNRRLRNYLERIEDPTIADSLYYDFPKREYIRVLFNELKRLCKKQKQRRMKLNRLKLLQKYFLKLKQYKIDRLKKMQKMIKGLRLIKELYYRKLIPFMKHLQEQLNGQNEQSEIIQYKLILQDAPLMKTQQKQIGSNVRSISRKTLKKVRNCSVCDYSL